MAFRNLIWIALTAALVLAALGAAMRRQQRRSATGTYKARGTVCSAAEMAFLRVLEIAVDPAHRVLPMVRLADVIQASTSDYTLRNRITSKHLDFVICERETTRPILAIELNDRSHTRADRQARDAFLADAMRQAGIPLVFQKAAHSYSVEQLRASINSALGVTRSHS